MIDFGQLLNFNIINIAVRQRLCLSINNFRFKQQRGMKQAYSLNMVDEGKLDVDSLVSVPPGCEKMKIAGVISISLKIQYISKQTSNVLFKTKLWGREQDDLVFRKINNQQAVLNLAIRNSLENASKYFNDMAVMCIECYISGKENQKQPIKSRQYTHLGRIYISIKRYVISFTLCDFQETCAILDQRKNKIGEVICKLSIDLARKNNFYPIATQPEIHHERAQSANVSIHPRHDYSPSHPVRMPQRKDSFQNQDFIQKKEQARNSLDQYEGKRTIVQHASRPDVNQEDFNWKSDRRKGKAVLFLQEYNRNKPEHSELSMIRQKYGFNCPSIEVMKLKLDQAILLSHHQESAFKDGSRINLLLKSIKNYSKGLIDSLVILYQQSQQTLKTETKMVLNQQVNGKIQINYLYVLPEVKGDDTITFQIKDAKIEVKTSQLKDKNTLDLKSRNGKKIATIQFALIQQQYIPRNNIPVKQQKQTEIKQERKQVNTLKNKQNCFLKVEGWDKGQVILRNKKIGVVNGPKIIYQIQNQEQAWVQIELFSAKNRNYIKANINHLLKQQNFIVDGKQVKIITARGDLPDLLTLISKIDQEPKKSQVSHKSQEQALDMKDVVNIFESLEKCQNEQCNQLIHSLSKDFNTKKLQKLSKLISVNNQLFENIINSLFNSSFRNFSQTFLTYHNWNHRYLSSQRKVQKILQGTFYNNDLLKAVKRLKRSSDVVFGIVPSSSFFNQFLRHGERAMTQQTQSQFNREQLGKLIVLLMERYPSKCIKISELEAFISQSHTYFNLNSYLLFKMVQEIINDQQSFESHLNDSEWNLIQTLKTQCDGQWGLAKLLLTNQDEMANSSTISNSQPERRETEHMPQIQQNNHVKTELSKQEQKKQHHEEGINNRVQTQKSHKQSITIIINDLIVPNMDVVQEIEIFSENQGLKLQKQQLIFPRAIELIKDSNNTVIVNTLNESYEGVFIANVRPQNVKLFSHGEQVGVLLIFSKLKQQNAQDEQIVVRIEDTQTIRVPHREELNRQQQEQAQIKCITPVAKSSFVKFVIRSIRPTRPNYKLMISSDTQRRTLNFPNQNEIILKNSNKGWRIALIDQQVEDITVVNHLSSNPYCFLDMRDQRVVFTAVIQVEQCWDPQLSLGLKQSLHLIIHFDQLLSVKNIKQGSYSLISQCEPQLSPVRFEISSQSSTISIFQSVVTQLPPERVSVKLIKDQTKQQLAEFRFALKLIDSETARNTRYLISNVKGYRLKITIFQIRHSWEYCRPDRVISLFNSENRRVIQSWIRSISDLTQEKLVSWIKANFQLALSQITILLEQLLHKVSQNSVQTFLQTFKRHERIGFDDIDEIKEQFSVFDYNDQGTINDEQLRIAKKVFNRSFKTFFALLLDNQNIFVPSAQVPNNFIIDLSAAIKSNIFDYLSFLDLTQRKTISNAIDNKKKQANEEFEKKRQEKGQYLSVKIAQFQNLSINKLPCTFLFKINDQVLAQPIHKCYSFKYPCSNEVIVPAKPPPQLHILLQSLKPNGTWEYKLLQTLPINEYVKVFGGFIKFIITSTNNSKPQKNNKKQQISNQNHDLNRRQNKYPSPKKIIQEDRSFSQSINKQFSKSFWNKSLNQTRQKWSQWKQSKKIQGQFKRPLKFEQNKSSSQDQY